MRFYNVEIYMSKDEIEKLSVDIMKDPNQDYLFVYKNVDIDDWDIEEAHNDDCTLIDDSNKRDFSEFLKDLDHYYFKNNLPKDETYRYIMETGDKFQ